jgi:DNA mismatch endonuclease (patch repair protein)
MMRRADGLLPKPSQPVRERRHAGNRRVDTRPERQVRSPLHAPGYRFCKDLQVHVPGARVRADIVFTRQRLAVSSTAASGIAARARNVTTSQQRLLGAEA